MKSHYTPTRTISSPEGMFDKKNAPGIYTSILLRRHNTSRQYLLRSRTRSNRTEPNLAVSVSRGGCHSDQVKISPAASQVILHHIE